MHSTFLISISFPNKQMFIIMIVEIITLDMNWVLERGKGYAHISLNTMPKWEKERDSKREGGIKRRKMFALEQVVGRGRRKGNWVH